MANGAPCSPRYVVIEARMCVCVMCVLAPFILEHDPLVLPGFFTASFAAGNFTVYPF